MRSIGILLVLLISSAPLVISKPQTLTLKQSLNLLEEKLEYSREALRLQEKRIQNLESSLLQAERNSKVLEHELQEASRYQESLKRQIEILEARLMNASKSLEISRKLSQEIETSYIPKLRRQSKVMKWQRAALWILIGVAIVEGVVIWMK